MDLGIDLVGSELLCLVVAPEISLVRFVEALGFGIVRDVVGFFVGDVSQVSVVITFHAINVASFVSVIKHLLVGGEPSCLALVIVVL